MSGLFSLNYLANQCGQFLTQNLNLQTGLVLPLRQFDNRAVQ